MLSFYFTCTESSVNIYKGEINMFPPNQEDFLDGSIRILQDHLAKMGIVVRRPEMLKDAALAIGELYHKLKKEEEF
jgi:hypothetical protein